MPIYKRRVIFNKTIRSTKSSSAASSTSCPSQGRPRVTNERMTASVGQDGVSFDIPLQFTQHPILHDSLVTNTSKQQDETVDKCLPFLVAIEDPTKNPFDFNHFGVPRLERIDHIEFLIDGLESLFPPQFVGLDASRPWMVYWAMNGLSLMGKDVAKYRKDVIKTFTPTQNDTGGFAGGHGQFSHLACSYPTILCLALAGCTDVYNLVNRKALWEWLGRLKQPDGGFQVTEGGEADTRGAYSAMLLIHLLNLPLTLPLDCEARRISNFTSFTDGLGEWITRCQTFEGGIGGSPGNEAHGAYTFCALACLSLLDSPHITFRRYLNLDNLITWLAMRQYIPEGGLSGRTNKLVDACYNHWCGGCFPLVQAALQGPISLEQEANLPKQRNRDVLFDREGLVRYTLSCCQQKFGGLRDKPGKRADGYHTNYALCGLSYCQHYSYYLDDSPHSTTPSDTKDILEEESSAVTAEALLGRRPSAFSWRSKPVRDVQLDGERIVWDEDDEVNAIHPVFVTSHRAVKEIREWAERPEVCGRDEEWFGID